MREKEQKNGETGREMTVRREGRRWKGAGEAWKEKKE